MLSSFRQRQRLGSFDCQWRALPEGRRGCGSAAERLKTSFALLLLTASIRCAPNGAFQIEKLGLAPTPRVTQGASAYEDWLLVTLFETRGDAHLLVIDLVSGKQGELSLPGATGADELLIDDANRAAYIGTSAKASLWRYDFETKKLSVVAAVEPHLSGEAWLCALARGPDGTIYLGTYPHGLLIAYDPIADKARNLGPPLEGRMYVRRLVVGASGTVYCGLGTPAGVVAYDSSGRFRDLLGPQDAEGTMVVNLRLAKGTLQYTLAQGTQSETRRLTVADEAQGLRKWRNTSIKIDRDGRYMVARGAKKYTGQIDLAPKQGGMNIMGLEAGPDGRIYGSTYYNQRLFYVEPDRGELVDLGCVPGASGEFQVMQRLSKDLLLPGYHGVLFLYELDRPWSVSPQSPNPRRLGEIGRGQGMAMATDRGQDGLIAIATPPDYGLRGGALTIFRESTKSWVTYASLVKDQALSAVCFGPGGLVYAGSSTRAGRGAREVDEPARLLAVDPESGDIVVDLIPVAEARRINALLCFDERRVLGGTHSGHLFLYDTRTGATRVLLKTGAVRDLIWWRAQKSVVGSAWDYGLFTLEPRSMNISWIPGTPPKLFAGIVEDEKGRLYVHDGSYVYRLTRR
jgi:hypothetical protein